MSIIVSDLDGNRTLEFDGTNPHRPGSVFVAGPLGLCIEFDRATFLEAVAREFGLADPLELTYSLPAAA